MRSTPEQRRCSWAGRGPAGKLQLRSRVMQDVILPRHPTEPDAQRDQARVLGTEAQRLAVLFAVVKQVPLIAFQYWPRDLDRLGQAALLAPLEEKADVDLAIAHRVDGVVLHRQCAQMVQHQRFQQRLRAGLRLRVLVMRAICAPPSALNMVTTERSFFLPRISVFPAFNAEVPRAA